MRSVIREIVTAVVVVGTLCFGTAYVLRSPSSPNYAVSVLPLIAKGQSNPFCTAFSINKAQGLWATAKHCTVSQEAAGAEPPPLTVFGAYAEVIYRDSYWDVAVIQSTLHMPALRLASAPLRLDDPIVIYGYPMALTVGVLTHGYVAALNEPLEGATYSTLMDITAAAGNSGSPVLRNGEVVGVVWGVFNVSAHAMSMPDDALRRVLRPFTE